MGQEILQHSSESEKQMWRGTMKMMKPVSSVYEICSQPKDGGDWMCAATAELTILTRLDACKVTASFTYKDVAGTNVRIFVREDGGRYLRTESTFVPETSKGWSLRFSMDWISFILLVGVISIVLITCAYFVCYRGSAKPGHKPARFAR